MTNNIYDTANQLERDLRTLPAYEHLKQAFADIQANETSKALFEEFKQAAQSFQMKQMTGEQLTDEEIESFQQLSQRAQEDVIITKLMESEQQVSLVLNDINRIITQPLQELYAN